jgi:hypothetical protein
MPVDLQLALQASTTKTATFNGSGLTIPTGTPRRGLKARVIYSANSASQTGDTITFSIDVSTDGGSTWNADFRADPLAQPTTANAGELFIPFEVSKTTGAANDLQIRLTATFSSTAHSNTITYVGDIVLARP